MTNSAADCRSQPEDRGQPQVTLDSIIGGARTLLLDLLSQALNLIVLLDREVKAIEHDSTDPLERGSRGSPISVRALKSSVVLLQFGILEALGNFTAELTVRLHEGLDGAVPLRIPLSQVELDFLREQRSSLEPTTGKIKIQKGVYVSTLDKLSAAPLLFAKSYGKNFRLDKAGSGWGNVQKLKVLRDTLTHIRPGMEPSTVETDIQLNLDKVTPSVLITFADLFDGSECILWYCRELKRSCVELGAQEHQLILRVVTFWEFIAYLHLVNLQTRSGAPDERLAQLLPDGVEINLKRRSPGSETRKL